MRHVTTSKPILFIVLLLVFGFSYGQKKAERNYKTAEKLFYEENFPEALMAYQIVLDINPDFEDADYKVEICSLMTDYRDKPLDKLIAFGDTKGKKDKFYHYWLGRAYIRKYMFEEATESWRKFLDTRSRKSRIIVSETKDFIKDAKTRLSYFENTDDYEIHQLDGEINTPAAELTPVFFPETNELLFASSRNNVEKDIFTIYHAKKQPDGWTDISELPVLGSFIRESANLEVVNEDKKLFLFDVKKRNLFFSETSNDKWFEPVQWDNKLTTTHIKSHFFVNEHEDRVIFATNKEAKTKGLDLYETFRDPETGKWTKPVPFANIINSKYDEDSPYLSPDEKTLYFSSNGHGSMGGMDIFKTEYDEVKKKWSKPVNMGFPINSPDDDVQFKMNTDGTSGYFSSNRLHTKGDFDIYFFWEIEKIDIEGRIYDVAAKAPITDAKIKFTPSQYTDEYFRSDLNENGKYHMEIISDEIYLVEVIRDRKTIFSDKFEIHETGGEKTTYIKDFLINVPDQEKIPVEQNLIAQVLETPEESPEPRSPQLKKQQEDQAVAEVKNLIVRSVSSRKAIIHNIYFGFGTSGISRSSHPALEELHKVLESNPDMNIEVSGHTDNIGTEPVNQWISENRAKSVKKWLVARGVIPDRIVAKGFGESRPIASNDDEKDGRELNRRIEVRVMQDPVIVSR